MNGFFADDALGAATTTVAAVATLVVLGGLFGERRLFAWSQHLLAGLVTGYVALLAIDEVIGPRLLGPLVAGGADRAELWLGLGLVGVTAAAPWLPRVVAAVPISIAVGALAAFALGGAIVGTLLPQIVGGLPAGDASPSSIAAAIAATAITVLVLASFIHGVPRGRGLSATMAVGRWLLLAGVGGWLGYLLLSRLVLLIDRIGFLLGDWLGVAP